MGTENLPSLKSILSNNSSSTMISKPKKQKSTNFNSSSSNFNNTPAPLTTSSIFATDWSKTSIDTNAGLGFFGLSGTTGNFESIENNEEKIRERSRSDTMPNWNIFENNENENNQNRQISSIFDSVVFEDPTSRTKSNKESKSADLDDKNTTNRLWSTQD